MRKRILSGIVGGILVFGGAAWGAGSALATAPPVGLKPVLGGRVVGVDRSRHVLYVNDTGFKWDAGTEVRNSAGMPQSWDAIVPGKHVTLKLRRESPMPGMLERVTVR